MMNMYSNYDNTHKNGMNYALKCTDNNVISIINCILAVLFLNFQCSLSFISFLKNNLTQFLSYIVVVNLVISGFDPY